MGRRFASQLGQCGGFDTGNEQITSQPDRFIRSEQVHHQFGVEPQHPFTQLGRQVLHDRH
ncbi:hypothetical protein AOZ06_39605 [Kibdelosporangium phytohabitans]|uniref:Uncharacterized protein n=1 Tax=Kibdelosporangium phytohabitans TaxID=860235 RepID=A0A0N9IAN5_9PSEU|nr:hypothetical protein AOZ06_39605 [Kibdelosporangium phytohabitans]